MAGGIFYINCKVHGPDITITGPDADHPRQGVCWDCSPDDDNPVWCPEDVQRTAALTQDNFHIQGSFHCRSADKDFGSFKEAEAWAESEGLQMVVRSDREWKDGIVAANKNAADKEARAAGFTDNEARKKDLNDNRRDIIAANRREKMEEYYASDECSGNDERLTIEEAYGPLPPA
jgi:hypothetical protein